jgi:SARP family transcriptional regulator, regulator of embCAB operon
MSGDDAGGFQLSLFQSWQLRQGGEALHVPLRQQRLITALALKGPRSRSYLVGLLWPAHSEPKALDSLRVSVHLIARQVPGLLANGGAVLSLNDTVEIDLHRLHQEILQLGLGCGAGHAAAFLSDLRRADLLPGWYEDWVMAEQAEFRRARLHALVSLAGELFGRAEYRLALEASEAALDLEPLYEQAVRVVVEVEQLQGNRVAALRAFENYKARLMAEMGLVPSEALQRMVAEGVRDKGY